MKRIAAVVIAVVSTVLIVASAVLAATEPSETVAQIDLRGYFIDAGVDVDINELERLVASTVNGPELVYFVALADDPVEGADLFATDVLERVAAEATVIVVSPGEIGARSSVYGDDVINAAVDSSLDLFNRSYVDGFTAFSEALDESLSGVVVTTQASNSASATTGGGGGGLVLLLVAIAIGGLIFFMVRRGKKNQQEAFAGRIEEIKVEVREQLGQVADDILELEDEVLLSDNDQAKDLYAAGAKAYAEFAEKLDEATTPKELHDLVDGLDVTQWQLEAAEALVDGKPLPPKPEEHGDHLLAPTGRPPQPTPRPSRPDLPPDLQLRRERGQRIPTDGSQPRQRSGGWLGGLGTAATILTGLKQVSGGRRTRSRGSGFGFSSGAGGPTISSPNRRRGRSKGRSSRPTTRSTRSSATPRAKTMRGRARRRR